jgi:hypothetical protein
LVGSRLPKATFAAAHAGSINAGLTGGAGVAACAAVPSVGLSVDARFATFGFRLFAFLLFGLDIFPAEPRRQRCPARYAQQRPPRRRGKTLGDVVESGMIHAAPPGWPRTVEHDASTTSYDHAKMAGRHFNTYRP